MATQTRASQPICTGVDTDEKRDSEYVVSSAIYNGLYDYTSRINLWLYRSNFNSQVEVCTEKREGGQTWWYVRRRITFPNGILEGKGDAATKRQARNYADWQLGRKFPKVQMNSEISKESNQGLAIQSASKESNTVITRDEGEERTYDTDKCSIAQFVSAEKLFQFPNLIGRWMPLESLEVTTEQAVGAVIATYYLPESLYQKSQCAPNIVPFETFIYSQLDIEMRFVVNAQRFHCGKVVASVKFDSYQADVMQMTAMAAVNRPHVILDLASNNQGVLKIPFRYHRGFVRNVRNDANSLGVRPSKFASVYVQYLSPLRTGAQGATNMYITPFYRFMESEFAAMSYRVTVQMDLAVDVVDTAYKASGLKQVLSRMENMALQFGKTSNRDKPTDYNAQIFVPRPRMNFGSGKGLSDAQPLKNNPLALTSCAWIAPFDDEPQTTTQIARIWGLRDTFTWQSGNQPNAELWTAVVDPCSRSYGAEYRGTPTPVEYICGMYNFWSGSLEFRFDFVSNAFHTGAVLISIEFGRPVMNEAVGCTKASTYTKTFHLGDQKSVTVVVPYIYDTIMRRSTATAFNPNFSADASDTPNDNTRSQAIGVRPESKTVIRVSVINDLRPISSTTQEIDVLVYFRGGETFIPHSLKQMSYVLTRESTGNAPTMDSFPRDGYSATTPVRKVRDTKELVEMWKMQNPTSTVAPTQRQLQAISHKYLPEDVRNEWNEYRADKLQYARFQADSGEKEDEDPTSSFSHGKVNLKVQTSDFQTSIKDILRRPALIVYRHTVNSNLTRGESFYLPIMPPSREFNYHSNQSDAFSDLIGQTPQAALMNLFRFWRGSSRYTIFVHSPMNSEPVYITHVPHTGARIIGNQVIGNQLAAGKERPIMGCGLTTEPLLPLVNPSSVVEVPYDTENSWTLTFEEDAQRNYAWRDKGDTNAGHIVITTTVDTQVSIWWSAGDDFDVANFYGIPECRNKDALMEWSDAHARVQSDEDFRVGQSRTMSSSLKEMTGEVCKLFDPKVLTKAMLGSIPIVGPALVGAPVISSLEKTIDESKTMMVNVAGAANGLSVVTAQLTPLLTLLNNGIKLLPSDMGSWTERISDFFLDILLAWYQRSWVQVGVSCVKLLCKILSSQFLMVGEYLDMFVKALTGLVGIPRVQAPSAVSTLVGAVAGIVGLALGVHINQTPYQSYMKSFSKILLHVSGVSYINQVIRFVQTIFDLVSDMVMDCLGYKSPEAVALRMLSGKDLLLKQFIVSAQTVLNDANSSMVLHPRFRVKFWYTVTQAYQIQQILTMVPANVLSPQLSKLCGDVIRVGNEKMMDLSCSPVRYEPFVICIEGDHGIGKSYLTESLVSHLLHAVGFQRASSGWTYTRAPGSKFWSGYRDQPAIIYDDWLNLNDPQLMSQQISELYQLKSTSTFIPEMAHLEEKRIKANPMVVILLTNGAFPSGMSNVAHHPLAVYRRRDLVLKAQIKQDYRGRNPRDLSERESACMAHLQFLKYSSSVDSASCGTTARSWEETVTYIAQKFKRYHMQEEINVRERVRVLREQLQIDAGECLDLEDPFSLLYKSTEFISSESMGNNAWLPSEKLEAAVSEIVEKVRTVKNGVVPIIVPPEPEDIFVQFACCPTSWTELGSWFLRGAVVTPELWSQIIKWSSAGIMEVIKAINVTFSVPLVGECCVCNESKELLYACAESQNTHRVCAECWNSIVLLSPARVCPMCRSDSVGVYLTPSDGLLATIMLWCASQLSDTALPVIRILAQLLDHFKSRALVKILCIGELLLGLAMPLGINTRMLAARIGTLVTAEIVEPDETFYDSVSEMGDLIYDRPVDVAALAIVDPMVTQMSHIALHVFEGARSIRQAPPRRAQSDDDWELPEPVDIRRARIDPLEVCRVNEAGFQLSREVQTTLLPQCYHHMLRPNLDTLIYRDSRIVGPCWQVSIQLGGNVETILVLDAVCQHDCYWSREEVHREFCELYVQRNQTRIARAQLQYVNGLQSNPEEFLRVIPRFARPDWANNQVFVEEVTPRNWWTFLPDTFNSYTRILETLMMMGAVVGSAAMAYKLVQMYFIGDSGVPVQGDPNYNPEHARFVRNVRRPVRVVRTPRTQGDTLTDIVETYVCRNYVRIVVEGDGKCRYLTAIGLYAHYAALPRHYVKVLQKAHGDGKQIYIASAMAEWAGSKFTRQIYPYDEGDFIQSAVSDIAYFKLPASFKMFKDIRKFLALQKDLEGSMTSEGKIIVAPTRENQVAQVIPIDLQGYQQSEVFEDADNELFEAYHVLRYTFSKQGACGSVVCIEKHQRPIVAMHCAGQGDGIYGIGWGVLLTQECVAEMLPSTGSVQCEEIDCGSLDESKFIFDEDCHIDYIGTVEASKQPHVPTKSKIETSGLHNRFGFKALTEPTILSKSDPRYLYEYSPLYYGVRKHGLKTLDFPTKWIKRASEALWQGWIMGMKPVVCEPKRLSAEQAVMGFEGNKYYEAISLNTSAGYPWSLGGRTTKDRWISVDWDIRQCTLDGKLVAELHRKEGLRREGIVPATIFVDTLKDERKVKEKVLKQGGTRIFCASPVDYTIALRQNLLHFCASFMKHRHQLMHGVGIDVHGSEWAQLWLRLTKHGTKFVGMDYANFGPAFNARLAEAASMLMNRWTMENVVNDSCSREEWYNELSALGWECDSSIHLCGNLLYQQMCGSPSGAPITVIKNSLVNLLYLMIAWENMGFVDELDIWKAFRDNVEVCVYGDDLVMTVSDEYRENFNVCTIQAWFVRYGIVSTDALKEQNVRPYVDANDITFLKRGWRRHPIRVGMKLAPLDIVSINDITQWVWRSADRREATRVNCESALLEAHGSGPEFYEALREKINKALVKIGCVPILMDWYDVDKKYYEEEEEFGA